MAYKQQHQYGYRDSLQKGDPEKVIKGEYFDDEFKAIEEAIADIDPNADGGVDINEIDGLQDALDGKADKDHTHDEYLTDAPNDGKQYVRESEAWAEVVIPDDTGIPEPNSDGTPYARQVEGGQTVGAWVEAATPEDIDYLDGRIDAIEGNISGGGGFVEAPDDGSDYARNGKSPAWVKTYNAEYIDALEADYKNADAALQDQITAIPDQDFSWDSITGKPAEFPPEAHTHTTDQITGLDAELDGIKDDITDLEGAVGGLAGQLAMGGSYDASTGLVVTANLSSFTEGQPLPDYSTVPNTFVIVSFAGNNPEELSEGDWLVAGESGWVAIKYGTAGSVDWSNVQNKPAEFPPEAHDHDGVYQPVGDYIEDANSDGKQYARQDGAWSEIAIPDGGTGSSVHIGDTPPDSPEEGQQWMEVPASGDATMWIYDGGKWLQHPGGKDGAPGADGNIADGAADGSQDGVVATWNDATGQWTPDSSLTIDASGGATLSGNLTALQMNVGTGEPQLLYKAGDGSLSIRTRTNDQATTSYFTFQRETSGDDAGVFRTSNNKLKIGAGGNWATTGMLLDNSGNLVVSEQASVKSLITTRGTNGLFFKAEYGTTGVFTSFNHNGGGNSFSINPAGGTMTVQGDFSANNVRTADGPVIDAKGLIKTLSTLRNATKDETTLEGLRDSIGNAIGGLIEEFENQIATMPAEDEA